MPDSYSPKFIPGVIQDPCMIAARFGPGALNLLGEMVSMGDPLADATIEEVRCGSTSADVLFHTKILESLASPNGFRSRHDCPRQVKTVPIGVNPDRARRAAKSYLTVGQLWLSISLGVGSLPHTFSSRAIASVLTETGRLSEGTQRRLAETGLWLRQVIRPDNLLPGNRGYVYTLQARLLHARIRARLLDGGWNCSQFGVPINQLDMVRTWLDFTVVSFQAFDRLGIGFQDDEIADLYQLWQWIGYLLGVDPKFTVLAVDQASGRRLLDLVDAASSDPDDNSRLLTRQTLDCLGKVLHPIMDLPEQSAIKFMDAICRFIHGDDFADKIGIQPNAFSAIIPVYVEANQRQREKERVDPDLLHRKMNETLCAFDAADQKMTGFGLYQ
jgi:hypothetical protein